MVIVKICNCIKNGVYIIKIINTKSFCTTSKAYIIVIAKKYKIMFNLLTCADPMEGLVGMDLLFIQIFQ